MLYHEAIGACKNFFSPYTKTDNQIIVINNELYTYSFTSKFKMPLEWLFGKKKTPEEMLRQNQRALNKAMRDLDRERTKMEQQEKKVIADIKKMAKQGQMV